VTTVNGSASSSPSDPPSNHPSDPPSNHPSDPPSDPSSAPRTDSVLRAVRELEQHVSAGGWDGPLRLFALIRTAGAIERTPELAEQLPAEVVSAAASDPEHLTAVEQENVPTADSIATLLGQIAWPPAVDGAALVLERVVLPPEAEAGIPEDDDEAITYLQNHPQRRDVRLAAAVLRDGTHGCAVRARDHDSDDRVAVGTDLVPSLVNALATTLDETVDQDEVVDQGRD
jgi:hypothetical protein